MDVIVSRHAKKRIKQRIHKNYQLIANQAWNNGVSHNELSGRLRKHIDWLVFEKYKYGTKVTKYMVYNENVFLFGGHKLITVLHLPNKFVNLARRLTKCNLNNKPNHYEQNNS